ncbi:hypothetical protein MNV49_004653 [Pseudohyphozyma bogoriensis]|nr:hypothetical protein MNV49_004653 [Pseudohyphozyma bogoriensis]
MFSIKSILGERRESLQPLLDPDHDDDKDVDVDDETRLPFSVRPRRSTPPPTKRRYVVLAILPVLLLAVALLNASNRSTPLADDNEALVGGSADGVVVAPSKNATEIEVEVGLEYAEGTCQNGEYGHGSWRMREGGVYASRDALNKDYDIRQGYSAYDFCYPTNVSSPDMTPAHLDRLLTAASYEWHPDSECKLTAMNRKEVIARLLKSYDGLWLIGDSLTGTHFSFLDNYLDWPGGPLYRKDDGANRFLLFDPNHPEAASYMQLAGVPKERFSRALVRQTRNDHLLSDGEIQRVSAEVGGPVYPGSTEQVTPSEWIRTLGLASSAHRQLAPENNVYLPTLVLASTGPHWTKALMAMTATEDVHKLYTIVANHVLDVMAKLEVDFYVRTTSPGHEYCWKYHEPEPSYTLEQAESKVGTPLENELAQQSWRYARFEWNTFTSLDKVWETMLPERMAKHGKTRFGFVNARRLDEQRPDLHLKPPQGQLPAPMSPVAAVPLDEDVLA